MSCDGLFIQEPAWDLDLQVDWDWKVFSEGPTEEFLSRFDELPDLGDDLECLFDNDTIDLNINAVLRKHDCMWAGTCLNKDHSRAEKEVKAPPPPPPPPPPVLDPPHPPVIKRRVIVQKSRSPRKAEPPRPETPPSLSESEEEAGSSTQVVQVRRVPSQSTVQFDHNYDKVRLDDLGVVTPSDSEEEQASSGEEAEEEEEEEEIDVVSLSRDTLPTNPTREMQTQMEAKMASAISTNTLLSASRAVSRRLNKKKRKRSTSEEAPRWRKKRCRFSDSEPDSEKRSLHNNMERMRRVDLRNAFDNLRTMVPTLADTARAPKVNILRSAASYCIELRKKEKSLHTTVSSLKSHQDQLRATLSRLRRSLAARR